MHTDGRTDDRDHRVKAVKIDRRQCRLATLCLSKLGQKLVNGPETLLRPFLLKCSRLQCENIRQTQISDGDVC
ncbi:hypothetical protein T4B_11354 [Trichinella pseudospiralis]|uniref:Uncharacterized protein n=1 Tax=Trichinella pseudospiralis TaxID=6337 RepID=A0A0V1K4X5_TRIPS|nr:hypothetical protein T4B_11354 [Trichinella pseudospiralis]KRZ42302.1 hypothetical protein T4C_9393 [Trichinella pseudospiralis]